MVNEAFPILSTPDLEGMLAFYRDLLDGEVEYRFPEEGETAYVGLLLGSSRLGIAADPDARAGREGQRTVLWVYVDDCDAAFERLRTGGATVLAEPAEQPWGERVARLLDPDGNEIVIGAEG